MTVAPQISRTTTAPLLRKKPCASRWKLSARLRSKPLCRHRKSRERRLSKKLVGKRRRMLNEENRMRKGSALLKKRLSGSVRRKKRCRGCVLCKNSNNAWRSRNATSNLYATERMMRMISHLSRMMMTTGCICLVTNTKRRVRVN